MRDMAEQESGQTDRQTDRQTHTHRPSTVTLLRMRAKGQRAVYSNTAVLSSRCRHSLVYPGPTLPKPGLSRAGTLG